MEAKTHPYQELFIFNLAREDYLQNQMNKVSRSFAVVVAPLEQPLRVFLSTAYLVRRVADNIEDCRQTYKWKEKRFGEFKGLLADASKALEVLDFWEAESWPNLTPDEVKLMGSSVGHDL